MWMGIFAIACAPGPRDADPGSQGGSTPLPTPPPTWETSTPGSTAGGCDQPVDPGPSPLPERLMDVRVIDDATGDGIDDALFEFWDVAENTQATRLVAGPLRRPIAFPDDVVAEFLQPDAEVDVADLDGDGLADFLVWFVGDSYGPDSCPGTTRFVASPVVGTVPFWEGQVFDGRPVDVDGDGVQEQQRLSNDQTVLEVRSAGPAGWAAEPFLSIDPSCAWPDDPSGYETIYEDPRLGWLYALSDLDGDGMSELWFEGLTTDGIPEACYGFAFSGDVAGAFDPVTDARAAMRVYFPEAVADQTGDGLADLRQGTKILASPIVFVDGGASGAFSFEVPYGELPLGIDLDNDGVGDWSSFRDVKGLTLYTGGEQGGIATGAVWGAIALPSDTAYAWFVEDGVASVVIAYQDATVEIVDIGPASAVD